MEHPYDMDALLPDVVNLIVYLFHLLFILKISLTKLDGKWIV